MKPLTKKQIQSYLKRPNHCPICKNDSIRACGPEVGNMDLIYQNVVCENCKAEWTETFKMSHIELMIIP